MSLNAILTPIVWRLPGRAARKLFAFALAEQGSLLDLTEAARRTPSPERAALYLKHGSDEARHARIFAARSAKFRRAADKRTFGAPRADSDNLFERLGEVGFLAFVYIGERGGRRQFEDYERYFKKRGDDEMASMFAAVLTDERRHENYTRELLTEVAGNPKAAKQALRRANRWRLWRLWRRAGVSITSRVYQLAMLVLYICLLPIALIVFAFRRPRRGWKLN